MCVVCVGGGGEYCTMNLQSGVQTCTRVDYIRTHKIMTPLPSTRQYIHTMYLPCMHAYVHSILNSGHLHMRTVSATHVEMCIKLNLKWGHLSNEDTWAYPE